MTRRFKVVKTGRSGWKTYWIAAFMLAFYSCVKDAADAPLSLDGARYFPLVKGAWIVYDVDSVVHRDEDDRYGLDTAIDRYHFQVKELVDSSFLDAVSDSVSIVLRYRRTADSLPWDFCNAWVAKRTAVNAQRVEENVRFVRLAFPVDSRTVWNGNCYNYFPEEHYYYETWHVPAQIGALHFDSTATVVQNRFTSAINRINKFECYAASVGLVEKRLDSLKLSISFGGSLILNGMEYSQRINSYGH